MHIRHLFLLALSLGSSSCSVIPKNAITIDRYSELDRSPKLIAKQFRISCRIVDSKGKVTQLPVVTANAGEEVTVKKTRELIYPTKFDLPATINHANGGSAMTFPITPTTPTAFTTREIGDTLTVVAQPRGPFMEIFGSFTSESYTLSSQGTGEAFSPITDSKKRYLLTENKVTLPQIKRIENLIYVVGLTETAHTIHLDAQDSDLIIICEVIK